MIGPPGSGKTTLLEHIALTYARGNERRQHPKAPRLVPALLPLREVKGMICRDEAVTLPEVIGSLDYVKGLNPRQDWFHDKLRHGRCLAMLDGLDEVADPSERKAVGLWVSGQMEKYPDSFFVVTSRPFGYKDVTTEQVVLEVLPLNRDLTHQFIHNWYLQNEVMRQLGKPDKKTRERAAAKADGLIRLVGLNPTLLAMSVNPLLLTMIATVHDNKGRLPENRVDLYEEICVVLLGKRQEDRNQDVGLPIPPKDRRSVFQVLALELMRMGKRDFTAQEGQEIIAAVFGRVAPTGQTTAEFFDYAEKVSGLLRQERNYEFAHKSLQEYLAAAQIRETDREWILIHHIADEWWEETIRLYALMGDATGIVAAALNEGSPAAFKLACDCVDEGAEAEAAVKERLEATLEGALASPDNPLFESAAETVLKRRLWKLTYTTKQVEVDPTCVTCAEYYLFLAASGEEAGPFRPAHWWEGEFPPGAGTKPVTGVSLEAAKAFCRWLNSRAQSGDYEYRLPTPADMRHHAVKDEQVGCWCLEGGVESVSGSRDASINRVKFLLEAELRADLSPPHLPKPKGLINYNTEIYWSNPHRGMSEYSALWEILNINVDDARALFKGLRALAESNATAHYDGASLRLRRALNADKGGVGSEQVAARKTLLEAIAHRADACRALLLGECEPDEMIALAGNPNEEPSKRKAALDHVRYKALHEWLYWRWHPEEFDVAMRDAKHKLPDTFNRSACDRYFNRLHDPCLAALALYSFAVITQKRTRGELPPFEGIRLVRDRAAPEG